MNSRSVAAIPIHLTFLPKTLTSPASLPAYRVFRKGTNAIQLPFMPRFFAMTCMPMPPKMRQIR